MNNQVIDVLVSQHKSVERLQVWSTYELKKLAYKESQSSTYVTSFLKY